MKLTVLLQGAQSSGKTQLYCWHTTGKANPNTVQTIEDSDVFLEDFQGRKIPIEILDTGGDPNYVGLLEDWVSRSNAQILVINLEDSVSIEYLREHKNILSATNVLARVVVGNLPSGKQENRIVTQETAKKLATDLGSQVYLEINTWNGEGVNQAFSALMDRVYGQFSKSEAKTQPTAAITANSSNVITSLTPSNITNAPINITAAPVPSSKTESMTVHVSTSEKDAEILLLKTRQAELESALAAQEKMFSSRLQSIEGKLFEITTAYQKLQEQAFAARLEALEARLTAPQKEELGLNKLVKAGSEMETPAKLKPAQKQIGGDVVKHELFTTP